MLLKALTILSSYWLLLPKPVYPFWLPGLCLAVLLGFFYILKIVPVLCFGLTLAPLGGRLDVWRRIAQDFNLTISETGGTEGWPAHFAAHHSAPNDFPYLQFIFDHISLETSLTFSQNLQFSPFPLWMTPTSSGDFQWSFSANSLPHHEAHHYLWNPLVWPLHSLLLTHSI